MINRALTKGIFCDLLAGLVATGVVFLAAVGTQVFADMRQLFVGLTLLFVVVGATLDTETRALLGNLLTQKPIESGIRTLKQW